MRTQMKEVAMKTQSIMAKLLAILLLFTVNVSFANIDAQALQCAGIKNDQQRLSCFDQWLVTAQTNKTTMPVNSNSIPMATTTVVATAAPLVLSTQSASDEQLITESIPGQQQPTVEKSTEQSSQDLEQGFGLEHKRTAQETDTDNLSFTISAVKKSLRDKWTLTFSNGQKWQTITSARMKFKVDQQVIISRGTFNSFSIKHTDSNRSVKIKRLH